jgi:hypothetical protein
MNKISPVVWAGASVGGASVGGASVGGASVGGASVGGGTGVLLGRAVGGKEVGKVFSPVMVVHPRAVIISIKIKAAIFKLFLLIVVFLHFSD